MEWWNNGEGNGGGREAKKNLDALWPGGYFLIILHSFEPGPLHPDLQYPVFRNHYRGLTRPKGRVVQEFLRRFGKFPSTKAARSTIFGHSQAGS